MRKCIVAAESVLAIRISVAPVRREWWVLQEGDRIWGVRIYENWIGLAIFLTEDALYIDRSEAIVPPDHYAGVWVGSGNRDTGLPTFGCTYATAA